MEGKFAKKNVEDNFAVDLIDFLHLIIRLKQKKKELKTIIT